MADPQTPEGKGYEMTDTPGFALLQEVLSIYFVLIEENPRLRHEVAAIQAERDAALARLADVMDLHDKVAFDRDALKARAEAAEREVARFKSMSMVDFASFHTTQSIANIRALTPPADLAKGVADE